jgi:selenocysteine lyase/cysteine desulfurase
MRPRDTGWFAAFGHLAGRQAGVPYSADGGRFMGATFDPSGCYRLAAVFAWLDAIGLTVADIHAHVMGLQHRFLDAVAEHRIAPLMGARLVTPAGDGVERGHFLPFETAAAGRLHDRLLARNIITDVRGDRLRFGFGCYHTEAAIDRAAAAIAEALAPAGA